MILWLASSKHSAHAWKVDGLGIVLDVIFGTGIAVNKFAVGVYLFTQSTVYVRVWSNSVLRSLKPATPNRGYPCPLPDDSIGAV